MRRFLTLVSALMLVLVLWTGTAVHAAEAMECGAVAESAAGHFEGDGDQVPSDEGKGTPHHHNTCHGHCTAVPSGAEPVDNQTGAKEPLTLAPSRHRGSLGPDTAIRPPIA
jgi:hypothetical protein